MSPRKTRRGRAREADETISTTIDDSLAHVESPSTHSRSLRARRPKNPKEPPPQLPPAPEDLVEASPQPPRCTRPRRTVVEPQDPNTSLTTTRKRRKPKTSDEEPPSPPGSPSAKRNPRKKKSEVQTPPDSPPEVPPRPDNPPDSDDNEVANASSRMPPRSAPTNRRFRQLRGQGDSPNDVTPESSPITVTLTPHRTTKTPRKSPVNLGSPKTHSLSPRRHSKTPRKLSVVAASPAPSDHSSTTGTPNEPRRTPRSPPKPEKSKNRTTLHSKTPKIVLRKSKSKSPPSARGSKVRGSFKKSPTPKGPNSPPEKWKSEVGDSPKNAEVPEEKSVQVLLQRISPQVSPQVQPSPKSPRLTSRLHSLVRSEFRSSTPRERAREVQESLSVSGTSPLNVSKFYGSPRGSRSASKSLLLEDESNPMVSGDDSFGISGIKPAEDDGEEGGDREATRSIHKDSTYELAEPKTPNLRRRGNLGDGTYELDEPKTPGLLKSSRKRSLEGGESPGESKRVCRVRFASPGGATPKKSPKVVMRSRSATPSSKLLKKRSPQGVGTLRRRSNSLSTLMKSPRSVLKPSGPDASGKWSQKAQNESVTRLSKPRLSISLNDADKKKKGTSSAKKVPNFAQIHQKKFEKMESLVDAKRRIEVRHNALTSSNIGNIKGQEVTTSGKPKEEEEVVKARIMTEPKAGFNRFGFRIQNQAGAKKNEGYNRFGFKVRKEEATKIVSRPNAAKLEERKEVKRMALKGVRTNKRFELLMKSRNMK
ncbi:serine/arginine repetitive matrix protein 1 [Diachasma alloeum]|uniref:serine/arginine repetitive matrix protein 1 n=1 Tax=Diachasma alloeum TaxID=454923 RepID=UPI00073839FC|nr:serine/arginine repetitive matrix protein 1 [Diachasma alloeum]